MDFTGFDTIIFIILAFSIGYVASKIHEELRIVLLLITGFLLYMFAERIDLVLDDQYVLYIALVALALYLFEYVPKIKFEHFDFEKKIAEHYLINSFISSLVAGYIIYLLTGQPIFYMFIFSTAMFITQLSYHKRADKSKIMHVLNMESTASIIFGLAFLFAFFDLDKLFRAGLYGLFGQMLLLSIGISIISGFLLLRFATNRKHHNLFSFIIVILTLAASERIALPGITLASTAFIFSMFQSERTTHTFDFFKKINQVTEVVVVIFAGFVFAQFYPKINLEFVLLSLTVMAVFFFMRFFVASFFAVSFKEKVFLTLNNPKGAVGSLVFLILFLTSQRYEYLWALFFMQIVFSEIVSFFSHSLEDPSNL